MDSSHITAIIIARASAIFQLINYASLFSHRFILRSGEISTFITMTVKFCINQHVNRVGVAARVTTN